MSTSSDETVHAMMHNEEFKTFLKDIMKAAVSEEQSEYRERLTALEGEVTELKEENERVKGDIHDIKCTNDKLRKRNKKFKENVDSLTHELAMRCSVIEDLQKYGKRNCIVVTGIPEEKGEVTDKVVQELASEKLGVEVEDTDIDRSHRMGAPKPGIVRPIITKFTR